MTNYTHSGLHSHLFVLFSKLYPHNYGVAGGMVSKHIIQKHIFLW